MGTIVLQRKATVRYLLPPSMAVGKKKGRGGQAAMPLVDGACAAELRLRSAHLEAMIDHASREMEAKPSATTSAAVLEECLGMPLRSTFGQRQ